jgi:outer membrane immunogenic protein
MRYIIAAALAAATLAPVAASAQDAAPANAAGSFGGFHAEGNVGWDKSQAYGRNNEKLGYGASAGFDGNVTSRIFVGPEVSYWQPNNGRSDVVAPAGDVTHQGRRMIGADVRIGYRVTPDLALFAKGGYVNQSQRTYFTLANGSVGRSSGSADGYQVGGGVQYSPHDRFSFAPANVYLTGQYVYSQFDNHTADQHAMAGIGFRFR